jgi:hypothetical protein
MHDLIFSRVFSGEVHTTEATCLDENSRVNGASSLCLWDASKSTPCGVRPPPDTVVFIATVAMVVFFLSLVPQFFLWVVMDKFASKRPRLEELRVGSRKLVPDAWLLPSPAEKKRMPKSALEKVVNKKTKASKGNSNRDLLTNMNDAPPVHENFKSPAEEASNVVARVRKLQMHDLESPNLAENERFNEGEALRRHDATARAIRSALGLGENGNPQPLSLFDRLRYNTVEDRLVHKLKNAWKSEGDVIQRLLQLRDYKFDDADLDATLIQFFALEQLGPFTRLALRQQLFDFANWEKMGPESINPYGWMAAWVFILSMIGFYLYWVYAWSVEISNGGVALGAWGWTFLVAVLYTLAVILPLKVLLTCVVPSEALKPQLRSIHRVLTHIALTAVQENFCTDVDFRVVSNAPRLLGFLCCEMRTRKNLMKASCELVGYICLHDAYILWHAYHVCSAP